MTTSYSAYGGYNERAVHEIAEELNMSPSYLLDCVERAPLSEIAEKLWERCKQYQPRPS